MVWDGLVAVDLFFAGLGAWAFIFAVILGWGNTRCSKMKTLGMIIGLVAVALGALILMVDAKAGLHNPLRLFYLLTNFGSVMTWGVVFISLFLFVCFVCLIFRLRKKNAPKVLEVIGCVFALGVAAYTGVLLGASSSYPLWNLMVLPVLFLVSAAYCGLAAVSLCGFVFARDELIEAPALEKVYVLLPIAQAVLVTALLIVTNAATGSAAAAGASTVMSLLAGQNVPLFWLGAIVVGIVVPIGLEIFNLMVRKAGNVSPAWRIPVECVCILIGGFVLRYLVVVAALPIVG